MSDPILSEIADLLEKEASKAQINIEIVYNAIRTEDGWLYIPIRLPGIHDALRKAELLQSLEDAWDNQEPAPAVKILLIPASNAGAETPRGVAGEKYKAALERSRQAVERLSQPGAREEGRKLEEYKTAQEALEQAVQELERVGLRDWPV